jgi:Fe-S oxidoreductase
MTQREGSLEAPTRHPLDWRSDEFYDEKALFEELERVFDICHGCRRCFNLCNSFPTLFDLIDESDTMEMDGVAKDDYWQVVDHKKGVSTRDKILSATDKVGKLAGIPVVVNVVNATNRSKAGRKLLESALGVHKNAPVPEYHSKTARKRLSRLADASGSGATATAETTGKVALFTTCYCNRNHPGVNEDLVAVFEHNDIAVTLASKEVCCGMPKLELGDLKSVAKAKDQNIPALVKLVDEGWDIVAPIPSCTLMFKQELPLMFPDDPDVLKVRDAMFDPFEYLIARHKDGLLKTEFKESLGKVTYQVPCHLRVQNIGLKTRDALQLVPGTTIDVIERCSGHDGTYAVKKEFHDISKKIARPVVNKLKKAEADHFASDCPMAAEQIVQDLDDHEAGNPMSLLRKAYGI